MLKKSLRFQNRSRSTIKLAVLMMIATASTAAAGEYLSGIEWAEPPVVTPGETDAAPPSDAIVLFDGSDKSHFQNADQWTIEDGNLVSGKGAIRSVEEFGDCQVHIEWSAPLPAVGSGQGRGNSGLFLMGRYEMQILDSYDNPTYFDGQAGAIYKQTPPLANANRPPGEWNAYDVFWTAPRFADDGTLESPAFITATCNGVLVLNHFELLGNTPFNEPPKYSAHGSTGPISLQDHNNPVRFRNIWVREIKPVVGEAVRPPFIRDGDKETPVDAAAAAAFSDKKAAKDQVPHPTAGVTQIASGLSFCEGPTADASGGLFFTDIPNDKIYHIDTDGQVDVFNDDSHSANGLWFLQTNQLMACEMDGQLVRYDIASGARTVLADKYNGVRFNACNDLVPNANGGFYFTDPRYNAPEPWPQGIEAVYYYSSAGAVTRVAEGMQAPNGLGLSPDGKRLYVAPSGQSEMLVYNVDGPGKLSGEKVFCRITQRPGETEDGSDGITIDQDGNVYFTTARGIEIVSPAGKSLTTIELPEHPANVTFAGSDRKLMIATARTSVYAVPMSVAGLAK